MQRILVQITPERHVGKMVGFSSDGASVMMGRLTGVQKRLADIFPFLIRTPCVAHKSSLVGVRMGKEPTVKKIEALVQALYSYFMSSSAKRNDFLKKQATILGRKVSALKSLCKTR